MSKYTGYETNDLTIDDALNDTEWGKQPKDYLSYITIEYSQLVSIAEDYDASETARIMQVIALYYVYGIEPDYKSIDSSGVRGAVRSIIASQKARLESVYVTHYKQYVSAMKRRERAEKNDT